MYSSMSVPCYPALDDQFRLKSGKNRDLLDIKHYITRSFLGSFPADHQELNEVSRGDRLLLPVYREAWQSIISSLDSVSPNLGKLDDPFCDPELL